VISCAVAWQIKDWGETPVTVGLFLALCAVSTICGVLRGHLVFTELMNRSYLAVERRRTSRALLLLDLLAAALLLADGIIVAATARPAGGPDHRARARDCARVDRPRAGDDRGGVWRGGMIAIEIRAPGGPEELVAGGAADNRCRHLAKC
jgi:hypothetical protein